MILARLREYAINLRASTAETRKTAMESSIGRVEMSIKEITKKTFAKDMVRCIGLTDTSIVGFGCQVFKMELDL